MSYIYALCNNVTSIFYSGKLSTFQSTNSRGYENYEKLCTNMYMSTVVTGPLNIVYASLEQKETAFRYFSPHKIVLSGISRHTKYLYSGISRHIK